MNRLIVSLLLFTLGFVTGCRSTSDLEVVRGFDIDRYAGLWYEAVRYPHRFEEGLTSVTAEYSLNENGTIKVVNRGYNPSTSGWEQADGVARFHGAPDMGWLEVSFFKPFYASYKILYLDDQYTEAIITGPTYNYLWILVRDPSLSEERLETLVSKAVSFGFETNQMIFVEHSTHHHP